MLENSRTQVLRKIENIILKYIFGKTYKTKHQTPTYETQKTQTRNLKWSQNNWDRESNQKIKHTNKQKMAYLRKLGERRRRSADNHPTLLYKGRKSRERNHATTPLQNKKL